MKNNRKKKITAIRIGGLFILLVLVVIGCVYIDGSPNMNQGTEEEPRYWVNAGDVATFTLNGHIECAEDHSNVRLIAAILVPSSWNARENTTVTYVATGLEDGVTSYTMSPIPVSSQPKNQIGLSWDAALKNKYGVGTNVLNDMEWVAFQTDKVYTILNHDNPTFTITFKCKTGPKNLKAHIGFFINHSDDGIGSSEDHYKVVYSEECFQVVNGTGVEIDYCNFHFNQMEPLTALQDDYITYSFVGDTYANDLVDEDAIYFEATAYTDNGKAYTVNERSDKTLMMKEDQAFTNTYSLTIWPTDFFGIEDGETITRIEYLFTNADGTVSVSQTEDDAAATGVENDGSKEPFVSELLCE